MSEMMLHLQDDSGIAGLGFYFSFLFCGAALPSSRMDINNFPATAWHVGYYRNFLNYLQPGARSVGLGALTLSLAVRRPLKHHIIRSCSGFAHALLVLVEHLPMSRCINSHWPQEQVLIPGPES